MDSSRRAFPTRKWVSKMVSPRSVACRLHYQASNQIAEGLVPSGRWCRVDHKLTTTNNCGNTTLEDATVHNFNATDKTLLQRK
jgi:hypothetical protein